MNEYIPNEQVMRCEELIARYVTALDSDDFETALTILELAQVDAELDRLIDEVMSDYDQEMKFAPFLEDAATVSNLLRDNLPIAFEAVNVNKPQTITLSDVARQIQAKGRFSAASDVEANKQLLQIETPLPKLLSLSEIRRVFHQLKIKATERFFRLFHETAILTEMKQGHQLGLQAAREKHIYRQTHKAIQPTFEQSEIEFIKELDETRNSTDELGNETNDSRNGA